MKVLILAGMVVVFISVIFILFILDDMTNKYLDCSPIANNKITCNLKEFGVPFIFSLLLMGAFVLIDCMVIYFLFKALVVKGSIGYAVGMRL
jgi:hypothetical protein